MKTSAISSFLLRPVWVGWRRWVVWAACIGAIVLLGALRRVTDDEFSFTSLAMLPLLVIAWTGGKRNGLLMAFIAAGMWAAADVLSERSYSAAWVPWANALIRLMAYCIVALLAAQVRIQFDREHLNASRDVLTHLLNRRAFLEIGDAEVERAKRYAHSLAVVFLDLDNFKQVNDTLGHDAGDTALRVTARALRRALRTSDQVSRMGGDEFAVLLPEIDYTAAVEAGEKLLEAVNAALKEFPPVAASVGVAWFGEADRAFPEMLKAADELMYEVKESGKGKMKAQSLTTPATTKA